MKTTLPTVAALAVVSVMTAPHADAASLDLGSRVLVSENNANFNISVFDGKARYDNAGTTQSNPPLVVTPFGDGTVEAYNFIWSASGVANPITYATDGSGIAPSPVKGGAFATLPNNSGQDWANVWTTNDPDSQSKNFSNGQVNRTHAGHADVKGTVDISGFSSGTLYFPHGTFVNQWDLELEMTGAGQLTLTDKDEDNSNVSSNFGWITDFTFTNPDGLYDTITYHYTHRDQDGSRARFMGVILDAEALSVIPSPTAAIFGLVGLAGLGMRRRRG